MIKSKWLFALLGAVVGFVLGLLIKNWYYLKLDPKIDIADVINILLGCITIYIGYHIATHLDRDKKREEYKHDFLLNKLEEFRNLTTDLSKTIENNNCQATLISFKLKSINQEYSDFHNSLDFCGLTITDDENDGMKSLLLHLKQLCTKQRRMKQGENIVAYTDSLEFKSENDIYTYSQVRVDEIKKQVRILNNKLFQYTIN